MFADDLRRMMQAVGTDPSFRRVDGHRLRAAEHELRATTSADGFRLAAMRLMALAGNGHSRAIANEVARVANLRFVWTTDGPCLEDGPHAGARLLTINGMDAARAFDALRPLLAGTDQRARALAGFMFTWPPAAALATERPGPATYILETEGGDRLAVESSRTVPALDLYPMHDHGPAGRLIAGRGLAGPEEARTGIFLRNLGGGTFYLRIGDLAAAPPSRIAAALDGILDALSEALRLVVDLRGNPGGDFFGAAAFARRLRAAASDAAVAVLVDKYTFSAAIVTAALLKVYAGGRIVGEEMGDVGQFHAEGGLIRLEGSGLCLRHSDGWHDWQEGRADPVFTPPAIAAEMVAAGSLLPDLPVALMSRDLAAGRDPVLDMALGAFGSKNKWGSH